MLTTLWTHPDALRLDAGTRQLTIGYRAISFASGLTVNNCKANLRSLQRKLALEVVAVYSNSKATTYRLFDFGEILKRREAAGFTHVLRSKGAMFVDPVTYQHLTGTPFLELPHPPPVPAAGIPVPQTGVPGTDKAGIPETGSYIRNKNLKEEENGKETSSTYPLIVETAARFNLPFDAAAVKDLVQRCRSVDVEATDLEISLCLQMKIQQLEGSKNIKNWVGLLITSVPQCFLEPATKIRGFRDARAKDREDELREARLILNSPDARQGEQEWARNCIRKWGEL